MRHSGQNRTPQATAPRDDTHLRDVFGSRVLERCQDVLTHVPGNQQDHLPPGSDDSMKLCQGIDNVLPVYTAEGRLGYDQVEMVRRKRKTPRVGHQTRVRLECRETR